MKISITTSMYSEKKVDFIGIGAQKAATSWLAAMLDAHPDVCVAEGKETHFFTTNYAKGIVWYHARFKKCKKGSHLGDFSTSYLSDPEAPERIHSYNKDIKLIVSLRNPIERAYSHTQHLCSKGKLADDISVQEAVRRFPEILENGLYGKHLRKYLEMFSKEQVHVVVYEDITYEPRRVIKAIYTFLGVDPHFSPPHMTRKINTSLQRNSRLFWFINTMHMRMKKYRMGRLLSSIARFFGISIHMLHGSKRKVAGTLSLHDRQYLETVYADDVQQLVSLGIISTAVYNRWLHRQKE